MTQQLRFNLPPLKRLFFFLCVALFFLVIGSVLVGFIIKGGMTTPRVRLATILQEILMFILPALLTALVITRQPADFLLLRNKPTLLTLLLVTATVLAAVPFMNYVIAWNASLTLPADMANLERILREYEESAQSMVSTLMGSYDIGSLIVTLLIVAILAGFSEELFFRGTLQRIFSTSGMNVHVAVLLTAFIFSALHFQFFGFVPRMLLGIYFGYLIVWTGSIWPAIWAHILNNTLAAVSLWSQGRGSDIFDSLPGYTESTVSITAAAVSLFLTITLLYITKARN